MASLTTGTQTDEMNVKFIDDNFGFSMDWLDYDRFNINLEMNNSYFVGADFRNTTFDRCDFENTHFQNCFMNSEDNDNTIFTNCKFDKSRLSGHLNNFEGTKFDNCTFIDMRFDPDTANQLTQMNAQTKLLNCVISPNFFRSTRWFDVNPMTTANTISSDSADSYESGLLNLVISKGQNDINCNQVDFSSKSLRTFDFTGDTSDNKNAVSFEGCILDSNTILKDTKVTVNFLNELSEYLATSGNRNVLFNDNEQISIFKGIIIEPDGMGSSILNANDTDSILLICKIFCLMRLISKRLIYNTVCLDQLTRSEILYLIHSQ